MLKNDNYKINYINAQYDIPVNKPVDYSFPKSQSVIKKLKDIASSGFSPSSLSSYIDDPLVFFDKYLLRTEEYKSVKENPEALGIGRIFHNSMQDLYEPMVGKILDEINTNYLHSVSFGSLRFPKQIFNTINNMYPGDELFSHNFEKRDNVYSYKAEVENEMISYCKNLIYKNVKKDVQIFSCTPY